MKNSIFKIFVFLLICLINSSCDNAVKTFKENRPITRYTNYRIEQMRDEIAAKVVDNKHLYDSLLSESEIIDSTHIEKIKMMNSKVQSFVEITTISDSLALNCDCEKPYEKLKKMFTPLYSSVSETTQLFEQISEKHKLKVKIAGEIIDENSTQEQWEKKMFYDLKAMSVSTMLIAQKVDVLVKEKEILEKLIQKQNASKTNHQN